jgi:hypothetical protein
LGFASPLYGFRCCRFREAAVRGADIALAGVKAARRPSENAAEFDILLPVKAVMT